MYVYMCMYTNTCIHVHIPAILTKRPHCDPSRPPSKGGRGMGAGSSSLQSNSCKSRDGPYPAKPIRMELDAQEQLPKFDCSVFRIKFG